MKEKRSARIAITFELKQALKLKAESMSSKEHTVSIAELVDKILTNWVQNNEQTR